MFESFVFNAKAFMVFSSLRMERGFKKGIRRGVFHAFQALITLLFFSKRKKILMFLWAWFRKVDDILDEEDNLPDGYTINSYLLQKKTLVNGDSSIVLPEDVLFIYSSKLISRYKIRIYPEIKKLFEVMEDEYYRRGKIISKRKIDYYMRKQDETIFKIIFGIFDLSIENDKLPTYFGIFTKIDSLLDIKEDLKIGLINISLEDCEKYNIDTKSLLVKKHLRNIPGLVDWYDNEVEETFKVWNKAHSLLSEEFLKNKKILLYFYQHLSTLKRSNFKI